MNEKRKQTILTMFTNCPVVSTEQIARMFTNAQPGKRASEALLELEGERLIEGKRRGMGESKVWRLTKKGRELMGVNRSPVPLNSLKVDHYLSLGDIWQELVSRGTLIRWKTELREPFNKTKYCADAFAVYKSGSGTQFMMIEYQSPKSPLSSKRWAEKWSIASSFFDSPAFSAASFQDLKNGKGESITLKSSSLKILVISPQQEETIKSGTRLPLIIAKDIKSAPLW